MIISVSNLGKRFNREWIFNGLTAEFKTGNTYAITGPNGSGKSTLMQVLWGQVPASEGEISFQVDGKAIPGEDVFNRIAIAAPYMDLIEEFTLLEQINFHFKFKNVDHGATSAGIIEMLQLESATHKPIKQFSSGMKQRVKLGLAMFSACDALFLDEPTTNLDNPSTEWYNRHLAEITGKKLVFIATNQPADYPANSTLINLAGLKKAGRSGQMGYKPI